MLSYMLPTEDKPPPGDPSQSECRASRLHKSPKEHHIARKPGTSVVVSPRKYVDTPTKTMIVSTKLEEQQGSVGGQQPPAQHYHPQHHSTPTESPKHNGTLAKKSTLHTSKVTKDDSLYSIDSDASTVGSDRKSKIFNGAKHASLKRVSFGSSKGSMVETLVYETPVQEEPEINQFLEHNGRLPSVTVPDTDEGREKVRVSLLGTQPSPATPGVLLLEPIVQSANRPIDMTTNPAELLTTHTEHTTPAYHAQIRVEEAVASAPKMTTTHGGHVYYVIKVPKETDGDESTDSGWDNPFRPDGDLSREADEIVELIKGGKPITPTPGQSGPTLPGCEDSSKQQTGIEHDSSSSPLLKSTANSTNRHPNSSPRVNQENGNAHGTPIKATGVKGQGQAVNEKVGAPSKTATVEVARMTAQGPGDASLVEHVTLKKKPKCKCCILQ